MAFPHPSHWADSCMSSSSGISELAASTGLSGFFLDATFEVVSSGVLEDCALMNGCSDGSFFGIGGALLVLVYSCTGVRFIERSSLEYAGLTEGYGLREEEANESGAAFC